MQVQGTKTAADTESLAETLNDQLLRRLVSWNYGPAYIDLTPEIQFVFQEPEERAREAAGLKMAVDLGLDVPKSHARKILGIPEPEENEEVLQPPSGGGGAPFQANVGAGIQPARPIKADPWLP